LQKLCADKINNTFYKDICPCYYNQSFYDNMVRQKMPNLFNTINRRADCVLENCRNSLYRSLITRPPCSNINNASCVMEYSEDLSGSVNSTSNTTMKCLINLNTNQITQEIGPSEPIIPPKINKFKPKTQYILIIIILVLLSISAITLAYLND
jgi:hypothetical protein